MAACRAFLALILLLAGESASATAPLLPAARLLDLDRSVTAAMALADRLREGPAQPSAGSGVPLPLDIAATEEAVWLSALDRISSALRLKIGALRSLPQSADPDIADILAHMEEQLAALSRILLQLRKPAATSDAARPRIARLELLLEDLDGAAAALWTFSAPPQREAVEGGGDAG